ncbi:hypothetical protein ACIBK9_47040 [Nonomuraea sp. NPDC050227]|uniref:hypothetical protein n=1 Tax=Nonomuraea sp. NPDC050227 TaxID=3364360 RepID=UPI00378F898E
MPDVFPNDLMGEIRQLQRDVEELKALMRSQPGKTVASQGWAMHSMTAPDTSGLPSGAGHVYFRGGLLRYRAAGNVGEVTLPAPVVLADMGDIATADAGSTYTATVQQLINEIKTVVRAFRADARSKGLMQ